MPSRDASERYARKRGRHEGYWWLFGATMLMVVMTVAAGLLFEPLHDPLDDYVIEPVADWWYDLVSPDR